MNNAVFRKKLWKMPGNIEIWSWQQPKQGGIICIRTKLSYSQKKFFLKNFLGTKVKNNHKCLWTNQSL